MKNIVGSYVPTELDAKEETVMEEKTIIKIESPKGLFDSHAHYFDRRFEGQAEDLLTGEIFGRCVSGVINVGTTPENSLLCIDQARRYAGMYAAVGIHPEDCKTLHGTLAEEVGRISALLDTPEKRRGNKVVALGEIGLDYHWEPLEKELQQAYFEAQLSLAAELDLPVIIHDREAHGDCFDTVLRYPSVKGVFHSYSGSAEMARELTKRGWYISFSGVLTFKNARKVREVAATVPTDRILIETDAPYLAPEPFRVRLNHSGLMTHTASALADVLGCTVQEIADLTAENARRLFGIE